MSDIPTTSDNSQRGGKGNNLPSSTSQRLSTEESAEIDLST